MIRHLIAKWLHGHWPDSEISILDSCYAVSCDTRVDYIIPQADKGDQSGFDIILEKHLNGKNVIKDMIDFFRER
jgi:hypothetical protein